MLEIVDYSLGKNIDIVIRYFYTFYLTLFSSTVIVIITFCHSFKYAIHLLGL